MRKLIFAVLVFGLVVVPGARIVSANQTHTPKAATYVVEDGDTLWSLAGKLAPKADPRAVVYDLMKVNKLGSAEIYSGQRLKLPRL